MGCREIDLFNSTINVRLLIHPSIFYHKKIMRSRFLRCIANQFDSINYNRYCSVSFDNLTILFILRRIKSQFALIVEIVI